MHIVIKEAGKNPSSCPIFPLADDDRTIPWAQAVKFDGGQRPVGYIARGSHGFWATAGTFTYADAVFFKLQDVTSEGGVAWDTKDSLILLNYPDTFDGSLDWLNYKGAWGNIGDTTCWWYTFHNECKVVTGPPGPLRDDVLAVVEARTSLSSSTLRFAMSGPLSVSPSCDFMISLVDSKAANSWHNLCP